MSFRAKEEPEIMIKTCMESKGIDTYAMAKFLKMDVKTFDTKVRNQDLNLQEVVTFSNHCKLDMKQIFMIFFPKFTGNHKNKENRR